MSSSGSRRGFNPIRSVREVGELIADRRAIREAEAERIARGHARVGVMTCALDEVACAAFTVGSLIHHVDYFVFLDTGSTDGTPELIEELYRREIRSGRLVIERFGKLVDYNMSVARTRALDMLRAANIDVFLKVDADHVFYDDGGRDLVHMARTQQPGVTWQQCRNYELYQDEVIGTRDWFAALRDRRDVFWEQNFVPYHDRIYAMAGAYAKGKWGDEADNRQPENIHYDQPGERIYSDAIVGAHYGWARPVERKIDKGMSWYGKVDWDPRIRRLFHDVTKAPQVRFDKHPEIIARDVEKVIDWYDWHARAKR